MVLIPWFYWNPSRIAFTIPFIDHPIVWYGVFFVTGFILGYFLMIHLLQRMLGDRILAASLADRLVWFTVLGTIVGARLGHVFFYSWSYYKEHLWQIPCVWQGGLASHGGAIGVLTALWVFQRSLLKKLPTMTYLALLDRVAIATALVGVFIRIGNFWNQEILGTPSTLPWAVLFGSPFDGSALVPRHPVQLYESCAYFAVFLFLFLFWKRRPEGAWQEGALFARFLVFLFSARFVLEFFKEPLTAMEGIDMGQWLSLPFIAVGIVLLCRRKHEPVGNTL